MCELGLQNGGVVFIVNMKETGHGVQATAHVLDDFTRQG